jgi:hypothetical protein
MHLTMPTYLLTISTSRQDAFGIRLSPGFRPGQIANRAALNKMTQGDPLELRSPSGVYHRTTLVTYGIEMLSDDTNKFLMCDDPKNPEVKLTVPADLSPGAYVAGTEVWLVLD